MDLSAFWKDNETWLSQCVAIVTTGIAIIQSYRKKKDSNRLKQIENRADAPFFAPYSENFSKIYVKDRDSNHVWMCESRAHNVLSLRRPDVGDQCQAGDWIVFPIENRGTGARWFRMKPEDQSLELRFDRSEEMSGTISIPLLIYKYDASKKGKEQRFTIVMETESGIERRHEYTFVHGKRELWRSNPPIPSD